MLGESTVYIVGRHLESSGAQARSGFFDPQNNYEKIPPYKRVHDSIEAVKGLAISLEEATRISESLQPDLVALQPLLERYAQLPRDAELPLIDGEVERGEEIGRGLRRYLEETGRYITVAETSPFERAVLTAEAILRTADPLHNDPSRRVQLTVDPDLHERQNGRAVELVSYRQIFLALNPEELVKWSKDPDNYRAPGDDAESAQDAEKRGARVLRRMQHDDADEGRVVYLSTHSETTAQLIALAGGSTRYLNTGTVTIFEAPARTTEEIQSGSPRRLQVKETLDFSPHP